MAVVVGRDLVRVPPDVLRPLWSRTDEAHVAAEDVDELRKFIERKVTQEAADARAPVGALNASGGEPRRRDERFGTAWR